MDLTVDRRAFSVVRRSDQAPDRHFWSAQPTAARIRAIELQRRIVLAPTELPPDFSEFLKLLNAHRKISSCDRIK